VRDCRDGAESETEIGRGRLGGRAAGLSTLVLHQKPSSQPPSPALTRFPLNQLHRSSRHPCPPSPAHPHWPAGACSYATIGQRLGPPPHSAAPAPIDVLTGERNSLVNHHRTSRSLTADWSSACLIAVLLVPLLSPSIATKATSRCC
jgi:hypothetical protein